MQAFDRSGCCTPWCSPRSQHAACAASRTESESSGDEDSADDFQPSKCKPGPPAARKPAPPAKKKSPAAAKLAQVGKVSPAKVSPAKAARDVAFMDGGLDDGTSSDDDMPLLARARAGK